jgi:hypothetical protein
MLPTDKVRYLPTLGPLGMRVLLTTLEPSAVTLVLLERKKPTAVGLKSNDA